jgi:hypothetical protein
MATKTVVVEIVTKLQDFPLGTVEGPFLFELLFPDGALASSVETTSPGASFPLVQEGFIYTARVTKNGVSVETTFDLPESATTFGVPDVITISISA